MVPGTGTMYLIKLPKEKYLLLWYFVLTPKVRSKGGKYCKTQ